MAQSEAGPGESEKGDGGDGQSLGKVRASPAGRVGWEAVRFGLYEEFFGNGPGSDFRDCGRALPDLAGFHADLIAGR